MPAAKEVVTRLRTSASGLDRVADLISHAFADDPLMKWAVREDQQRPEAIRWLYGKSVEYGLNYGEVYTTRDVDGVSVWLPPGETQMSLLRLLQMGMLMAPLRLGIEPMRRLQAFSTKQSQMHRRSVGPWHWYLQMIAVAPGAQGRGLGGALLQPILTRADQRRLPCYLDTTNRDNIAYFERLGFVVTGETHMPDDGPTIWGMRRDPR